jgi:hypothetical protein
MSLFGSFALLFRSVVKSWTGYFSMPSVLMESSMVWACVSSRKKYLNETLFKKMGSIHKAKLLLHAKNFFCFVSSRRTIQSLSQAQMVGPWETELVFYFLLFMLETCIHYFCITVTKIPDRSNLREEGFIWLMVWEISDHCSINSGPMERQNIMAAEVCEGGNCSPHGRQEAESEEGTGDQV